MARRDRQCYLCGQHYKYCPTCSEDRMKPAFMAEFHSENCKHIFEICTNFNLGLKSKLEAQEALIECDLSEQANFKPYVQRDIENIFAEEPKKRGKRAELNLVDEMLDSHEVVLTEKCKFKLKFVKSDVNISVVKMF